MESKTHTEEFIPLEPNKDASITSNTLGGVKIIPQEDFDKLSNKIDGHKKQLNLTNAMLIGVVVVLFVTFLTLIIDAYRFKSETYQNLIEKVDEIKKENINANFKQLNEQIDKLNRQLNLSKEEVEKLKSSLSNYKKIK